MSIPHVIGGEITSQELNDNFSYLDSYKAEVLEADTVVTVGSNGDFGTINMALTMFTRTFPYYEQNGLQAEIRLLSGFVMEEQVLIKDLDMGWITITSEDAEVMVNRLALTTPFTGNVYPLFGAENAVLPVIDVLFNMDNSGTASGRHGFVIRDNSRAHFKEGAGCKNTGDRGLHVLNASVVFADGVIFSGAGSDGVVATGSSTVSVRGGNFSNAGHYGVWSINNSMINCREVDATNASADGIRADTSSVINARFADASGAGDACFVADGSRLYCREANAQNAGGRGVWALNGSTINAHQVNASGAGNTGAVASGSSVLNFRQGIATNCETYGIQCVNGSFMNAREADFSGATVRDMDLAFGSIIAANGSTGELSQSANTITANGIVFK